MFHPLKNPEMLKTIFPQGSAHLEAEGRGGRLEEAGEGRLEGGNGRR